MSITIEVLCEEDQMKVYEEAVKCRPLEIEHSEFANIDEKLEK